MKESEFKRGKKRSKKWLNYCVQIKKRKNGMVKRFNCLRTQYEKDGGPKNYGLPQNSTTNWKWMQRVRNTNGRQHKCSSTAAAFDFIDLFTKFYKCFCIWGGLRQSCVARTASLSHSFFIWGFSLTHGHCGSFYVFFFRFNGL